MSQTLDFSPLANVLPNAKSILVFIHPQATYDAVAAGLALAMSAREAGKVAEVICEEPMRVEYNYLVNIDQVKREAGNRDLVISFDYSEDQVDKVSYNIDETRKRFELIVSPKSGNQPLDPQTVNYTRAGLAADVIFLFGYHSLEELGEIYQKEKFTIDQAYTVAFTQNKVNSFGKLHLTLRPDGYSYSEMVYFMVRQLQLGKLDQDVATNLLSGIEYATEHFMQPNLPARIFDTVAQLMRAGGKRRPDNPAFQQMNTPIRRVDNPPQSQMPTMGMGGAMGPQSFAPQGMSMPQGMNMSDDFMPAQMPQPVQAQQGQIVSSADFAKAMSGGQK